MRAILTPVLCLLISNSLFAQVPSQLHIVGSGEELSGELVDKSIKDANGQVCAGLAIISDIGGLTYDSNNGIQKLTHTPGKDLLFLSSDERVVTIQKSGYLPLRIILNEYGVHLKTGTVWQLKITGDNPHESIPVSILSTPPGATVFIDGVNRGNGQTFQLSPGKHAIRVEKEGYERVEEIKDISSSNALFTFPLKDVDVALVTVTSNPQGAELSVDGSAKGQTNRAIYLLPGSYRFRLEKPDYLPADTTITIQSSGDNRFVFTLFRNMGTLNLAVTPADATVRMNQKDVEASKPIELPPGEYELSVNKSGFLPHTERIQISRGASVTRTIILDRNAGTLNLTITPSSANIRINKEDYTGKTKVELSPGAYRLELSSAGYDSLAETIQIVRGQAVSKNYILRQQVGKLQFNAVPLEARATLMRENKRIDEWVGAKYVRDLPVGEYDLVCKSDGYKSAVRKVHIHDNQVEKLDVVMEKGSDTPPGMVLVEGGTFEMGSKNGNSDERLVHQVSVSSFFFDKYEVTVGQYRQFCTSTGRSMPSAPIWGWQENHPIVNVTWEDAAAYAQWAGKRLPTEAEWEYAARGGRLSKGYTYSGGNDLGAVAWYDGNSGKQTHPVGERVPNELGLYDMSGNAWEWCADWYDKNYYYLISPKQDPKGPSSGYFRAVRGGSWSNLGSDCRLTSRGGDYPSFRYDYFGFRCAQDAK
jgi:formylglycine-generating enzyme required for sulfatase activity